MRRLGRLALKVGSIVLVIVAACVSALVHMTSVPGRPHTGPLPALTEPETATAHRLRAHIATIANAPHNLTHYAELEKVARYIEGELSALGYIPTPQIYTVDGKAVRNIEATIEPRGPGRVRGTIVVGAHYDSYGDAPGANDNGTGTAATLELARLLVDLRATTDVRIRLVLFVNEEPPYFQTPDMGSYRYAKLMQERREPIIGMISLETMGYFREEAGTQNYPPPFGLLYPSEANFIAFVGMMGSRDFVQAAVRSFRSHTSFPSVGGVAPGFVPGIGWSDHWSFAGISVPALMITDTAPFRYGHYHLPSDTPDKIDYERLARITAGVERLIRDMANVQWPIMPVAAK
jgi:hypothetical protein